METRKTNKDATKKVTISFKEYFKEEYEFLNQQHNRSLFICELIRAYMNGEDMGGVKYSIVKQKPAKEELNNNEVKIEHEQEKEEKIEQEVEQVENIKKEKKKKKISGVVG